MTPATEDWSEIGTIVSDTTESPNDTPPTFSRQEVEGARDLADAFSQSLDMLLNEFHVEKAANAVLSAKWSASASEQCKKFMENIMDTICDPEEEEEEEYAEEVVKEDEKEEPKDEAFEAIMGNMGAEVTLADIVRLVFLWTKSERFWDIQRPV
ncbi:hypothetical protein KCU95_g16548, partial [Aureobasidium melanogenum]